MYLVRDLEAASALDEVLSSFATHAPRYAGVRVRAVAVDVKGSPQIVIWCARAYLSGTPPDEAPDLAYPWARFLNRWIEPEAFPAFLRRAWSERIVADLPAGTEVGGNRSVRVECLPASNAYSDLCGTHWSRGGLSNDLGAHGGLLVSFGQPLFEDLHDAMGAWLEIGDWHGGGDGRVGSSLLFLPETRARFQRFSRTEETRLDVEVTRSRNFDAALRIKAVVRGARGQGRLDVPVTDERAVIEIPDDARALELCLVGVDDAVLDLYEEDEAGARGIGRALHPVATEAEGSRQLRALIDGGETDEVEFKPYVELKNPKCKEVVESVIAFANARGGTVLIGVDDHGGVEGVEGPMQELADRPKIGPDPMRWYRRSLLGRLRDVIDPTPEIAVEFADLDGHQIVVIQVKELPDKPCEHVDTHQMFIRRGATDRLLSRPELDAIYAVKADLGSARRRRRR